MNCCACWKNTWKSAKEAHRVTDSEETLITGGENLNVCSDGGKQFNDESSLKHHMKTRSQPGVGTKYEMHTKDQVRNGRVVKISRNI